MTTRIRTPMDAVVNASMPAVPTGASGEGATTEAAAQPSRRSFLATGGAALVLGFVVPRLARAGGLAAGGGHAKRMCFRNGNSRMRCPVAAKMALASAGAAGGTGGSPMPRIFSTVSSARITMRGV